MLLMTIATTLALQRRAGLVYDLRSVRLFIPVEQDDSESFDQIFSVDSLKDQERID